MPSRGRPRKPTALKVLEGNPGKRPLNTNEPKPKKGSPNCPSWLMSDAKKELLKYQDMIYYEKPKQYDDLKKYIEKNFFYKDPEKAEMLCQNIMSKCRDDFKIQEVFDYFNTFEVDFKDEKQVKEVLQLVMELSNNVRLWENNGHTPSEIFEKFEKPNLRPLPDKPFNFNDTGVIDMYYREKISRNDPCPCGSGKKYKKCCIGKDET